MINQIINTHYLFKGIQYLTRVFVIFQPAQDGAAFQLTTSDSQDVTVRLREPVSFNFITTLSLNLTWKQNVMK